MSCHHASLDVALEFDTQGAIVPEAVDAAIDFGGLIDEAHVLAEFGELGHVDACHRRSSRVGLGLGPNVFL